MALKTIVLLVGEFAAKMAWPMDRMRDCFVDVAEDV